MKRDKATYLVVVFDCQQQRDTGGVLNKLIVDRKINNKDYYCWGHYHRDHHHLGAAWDQRPVTGSMRKSTRA